MSVGTNNTISSSAIIHDNVIIGDNNFIGDNVVIKNIKSSKHSWRRSILRLSSA